MPKPDGLAAVQNLYLQCYTQQEIADHVGMPQPTVNALLSEIQNFEIPIIPGQFTEDLNEKTGKALKAAEEIGNEVALDKATVTRELEALCKESSDSKKSYKVTFSDESFSPPIYNVWAFGKKSKIRRNRTEKRPKHWK